MATNELKPQPDWKELLRVWNSTESSFPAHNCLHELFEQQVLRTPNATALIFEEQSLTYAELNTRANQLATYLRSLGVGPDVLVGLYFERSLEMVVAIYATLKAGGAYVPIDPGYPADRIRYMLADSECPVILTHKAARSSLPETTARVIELDAESPQTCDESALNIKSGVSPSHLAYVIYTSGSTGQPKGVMNTHLGIVNRLWWMQSEYRIDDSDTVLQKTPYSFDVSVWEFFWPLFCGSMLVVAKPDAHKDAAYLQRTITRHRVTTIHFVPSMLAAFSAQVEPDQCEPLKRIICSGEALSVELQNTVLRQLPWVELHNLYGPTEAAVDVTYWKCKPEFDRPLVPIGRAISNTQLYVVDEQLRPVPPGIEGELLIGGIGVARGYWRKPELTAQKFIPDHLSNRTGGTLFRTADLARYIDDGNIEFLGRIDHQVKIRGFRIELGEVETAIGQHPAVQNCAVIPDQPGTPQASLQAWLIRGTEDTSSITTAAELRAFLTARLPEYMIPNRFFEVDSFPLSPNGKLDRKALAEMKTRELPSGRAWKGAETTIEKEVLAVCEATLRRNNLSLLDHFFEFGGHSLLAVLLTARLSKSLERQIPLQLIFENPVLVDFSKAIENLEVSLAAPVVRMDRKSGTHLASFGQQRMWLLQSTLPDPAVYNVATAWKFSQPFDNRRLQECLTLLMERHEALRSQFRFTEHGLEQQLLTVNEARLPWFECTTNASELNETLTTLARSPFDLEIAPLWRADWIEASQSEFVFMLTFQHSIIDEWSIRIIVEELSTLFSSNTKPTLATLAEVPLQPLDIAHWERTQLTAEREQTLRAFWESQLRELPDPLELPADLPRSGQPAYAGRLADFEIDSQLVDELRAIAQAEQTTLFTVTLAAWAVWLYRYTGQTDLLVGTPVTTRQRVEFHQSVGFLLNTVPVRTKLSPQLSFRAVIRQVRSTLQSIWNHADLPFEKIVETARQGRSQEHHNLFQSMFVLLEEGTPTIQLGSSKGVPLGVNTLTAKTDVTLFFLHENNRWTCRWETLADMCEPERAELMNQHWTQLLKSAIASPELPVSRLELMTPEERHRVIVEWNQTDAQYPTDKCLHHLFEDQVVKSPDATAISFEGESLTYDALNKRANALASYLRHRGIGPEALVGLYFQRSLEMIVAIYGTIKAGAAYVPIDPGYPQERILHMVEDADCPVILTHRPVLDSIPHTSAAVVVLDSEWDTIRSHAGEYTDPGTSPSSVAYVIYTSGSTGRPKGVMNTHAGIVNHNCWMQSKLKLSATDVVLFKTPYSFDVSLWELFVPLACGAQLVIAQPEGHKDSLYLEHIIETKKITAIHFVPSMLAIFIDQIMFDSCRSLRILIVSGEALSVETNNKTLARFPTIALYDMYGPTEAAVHVSAWECRPIEQERLIPIGKPIANLKLYIVDKELQPVPPGVNGELLIGGVGVARGYWRRPELTMKQFIPDHLSKSPTGPLYKTGDLTRHLPTGEILYLGRLDHQIKIRGFRIELGEIEAVLSQHLTIDQCVILPENNGTPDASLVAFFRRKDKRHSSLNEIEDHASMSVDSIEPTVAEFRVWMAAKLPDYMIPRQFVEVDTFPTTPNGKLNRAALLSRPRRSLPSGRDLVLPSTVTETTVLATYEELLAREGLSALDHFFELGGHSLLAVSLAAKLTKRLNRLVHIALVFEYPVIRQLAEAIDRLNHSSLQPLSSFRKKEQFPRASFGQRRMWLLQSLCSDPATYNVALAWRFEDVIDESRLRKCFEILQRRHESLRTSIQFLDGDLQQVVHDADSVDVIWFSISCRENEIAEILAQESRRPFELDAGPLWRANWIDLKNHTILLLTFHHCIIDEWSVRRLIQEVQRLYVDRNDALNNEDQGSRPQAIDFAHWEHTTLSPDRVRYLRQYWQQRLAEVPDSLELPFDFPRSADFTGRGSLSRFEIDERVIEGLRGLAKQEGTTLFNVLFTAWFVWLYRYTHQSDLVSGIPVTSRRGEELESVVGYLLNTIPVRYTVNPLASFRETLRFIRSLLIEDLQHSEFPFEQIVEAVTSVRNLNTQPLLQNMFVFLEEGTPRIHLNEVTGTPLLIDTQTAKADLTLSVVRDASGWVCLWELSTDLFDPARANLMNQHWTQLLESILANPDSAVSQQELMTPGEKDRVLVAWNNTQAPYPRHLCLHELFEEEVRKRPNVVAIITNKQELTYEELSLRSRQIATCLMSQIPETRLQAYSSTPSIGICLIRSSHAIASFIAALRVGGCYVPLDPKLPDDRLIRLIKNSDLSVLICESNDHDRISTLCGNSDWGSQTPPAILVVDELSAMSLESTSALELTRYSPTSESPAYMIFTSGTTGEPKGVLIPHRAVTRLVINNDYISLTNDERILQLASLSFDASTLEIWGALLNGGTLILMPDQQTSLHEIASAIQNYRVTTLWLTAGLFHLMVEHQPDSLRGLRQLLAGGDVLSPTHVETARELLANGRLINGYGPTENTTFTCTYQIDAIGRTRPSVPIGRPIRNTTVYLLDPSGQPVPTGVIGELFTGGDGVGLGYLHAPERTAEKFLPDPFATEPGRLMYRTGDHARYLSNGLIEFRGRIDSQVKIRGFRIEPGEIEEVLRTHSAVQDACVIPSHGSDSDKVLIAYLLFEDQNNTPSLQQLRQYLKDRLPEYMVPSQFRHVSQFPLNSSGKVDRKRLTTDNSSPMLSPHIVGTSDFISPLMLQLKDLWKELLRVEDISLHDNFFEVGGHSLLAARMTAKIRSLLDPTFSISDIFRYPDIRQMAERIFSTDSRHGLRCLVPLQPHGTQSPLFCIHGWGGTVFGFQKLAYALGETQPVYGLQALGLENTHERQATVEDMARLYADEIEQIKPEGPYQLTGYSLGGWMAHAVGRELHERGHHVSNLILIDTQSNAKTSLLTFALCELPTIPSRVRKLVTLMLRKNYRNWPTFFLQKVFSWYLSLPGIKRYRPAEEATEPNFESIDPPVKNRIIETDYFYDVVGRFEPQPFPTNVTVITSPEERRFPYRWFWRKYVDGEIRIIEAQGDHHSMLKEPNLQATVEIFRLILSNEST